MEVGRGGFGVVYAVELPSLPGWGRVAVKRALSGVDAREVMAEVSNLRRCAHRDVLPLLGYCGAPRAACIVTALMRGGSLDDHLLLSPDARARLQKLGFKALEYLRPVVYYGFIPAVILVGMRTEPRPRCVPQRGARHRARGRRAG